MTISPQKLRWVRGGFALPVVMIFVVACAILAIGLFLSLAGERNASRAMLENETAKTVTQTAISHAQSLLQNIPQPVAPGAPYQSGDSGYSAPVNWATSPGQLVLTQGPNTVTTIPLSSNPTATYTPVASDADVNQALLDFGADDKPVYPILGADASGNARPIRVAWVNLLRDPTQPASKDNPLVARYAFWIDDETTKLNLNTGFGKPDTANIHLDKPNPLQQQAMTADNGATGYNGSIVSTNSARAQFALEVPAAPTLNAYYPLWHPISLNLDVLDVSGATLDRTALSRWVHNYQQGSSSFQWRPLDEPSDVLKFVSGSAAQKANFWSENSFQMTTTGRSAEFNPFGKPKIFTEGYLPRLDSAIGFQLDYDSDGPTYTHAGETATRGTGGNWAPNANGLPMVMAAVAKILNRNDWPGMPARSFVDKWGGDDKARREADQVAANLVVMASYGAGKEYFYEPEFPPYDNGPNARNFQNPATLASGDPEVSKWAVASRNPNRFLFPGTLSGKAIMPYLPLPLITEIIFCVEPVEVLTGTDGVTGPPYSPRRFRLRTWLEIECHLGGPGGVAGNNRMAPIGFDKFNSFNYRVQCTYVGYKVYDSGGALVAEQDSNQYRTDGYDPSMDQTKDYDGQFTPTSFSPAEPKTVFSGQEYYVNQNLKMWAPTVSSKAYGLAANSSSGSPAVIQNFTNGSTATVTGSVRFDFKARLFSDAGTTEYGHMHLFQVIPVWDDVDDTTTPNVAPYSTIEKNYFRPPTGEKARIEIATPLIDLAAVKDGLDPNHPGVYRKSLEISDPRMGGNSSAWALSSDPAGTSRGAANAGEISAAGDKSKVAYYDFQNKAYYSVFPRGTLGMLSTIPTGMQRGIPYETFRFQPSANKSELPDWLMLDLFSPALAPWTRAHSVAGKINPNAALTGDFASGTRHARWKPLQALVQNMKSASTVSVPATAPSTLADNVLRHQLSGQDFGAQGVYDYIGEICEAQGFADTGADNWEKEALIRNLANMLTTKSNSFTVWGLAQVIRKKPSNTNYGVFEPGDKVVGEKRFVSEIERYVWPGKDGTPGNASVAAAGAYDKTAKPMGTSVSIRGTTQTLGATPWSALPPGTWVESMTPGSWTWPEIDGPNAPTYKPATYSTLAGITRWGTVSDATSSSTALEDSNNPLRAWMRLRVNRITFLNQ